MKTAVHDIIYCMFWAPVPRKIVKTTISIVNPSAGALSQSEPLRYMKACFMEVITAPGIVLLFQWSCIMWNKILWLQLDHKTSPARKMSYCGLICGHYVQARCSHAFFIVLKLLSRSVEVAVITGEMPQHFFMSFVWTLCCRLQLPLEKNGEQLRSLHFGSDIGHFSNGDALQEMLNPTLPSEFRCQD